MCFNWDMSKATWTQTEVELARSFAEVAGIKHLRGGHLYDRNGKHVAHGWDSLAAILTQRGVIKTGSGINWRSSYARKLVG